MATYGFDNNAFVIDGFDKAKPFASFLPGLAGAKGIPMWTFYVNRGQGICSFGVRDKKSPIVEFSPASITYKLVSSNGFRTFIKLEDENGALRVYEPFQSVTEDAAAKRTMRIRPNELVVEEEHGELGLTVRVTYFNVPGEDFAALARHVEIKNLSGKALQLELLDGLPEILPYGVENAAYKEVGNLMRSWMEVYNLEQGIPFYKVRSSTHDEAEISEVQNGHFYFSFSDEAQGITPIVDFELVFGSNTALTYPERFAHTSLAELQALPQVTANKVPCGFTGKRTELADGKTLNVYTLVGHVSDIEKINRKAGSLASGEWIAGKREQANKLAEELTEDVRTKTAFPLFDEYCRQTYMDNFLRGGYPMIFDNGKEGFVYHLFSRKHGDMERDYNFFTLAPEYYSQGNGNFRDMNQNRRNDVFFHPKVGAFNVNMFFSLMQADGYNPLSVEGSTFRVPESRRAELEAWLAEAAPGYPAQLLKLCSGSFTPGKVVHFLADHGVEPKGGEEAFLTGLLSLSEQQIEASFGEGYWIDHWTYNMDLVDSFLSIFPDKKNEMLFAPGTCTFFDTPVRVLPRSEKTVLNGDKVRQYGSVVHDDEKMKKFGLKLNATNWLKTKHGAGDIYRTNVFVKMISLGLNKFSCMDPYGMGIEMEANKPGWNDAMNGLPGLFSSGMSETFELKRLLTFVQNAAGEQSGSDASVSIPEEIHELLLKLHSLVSAYHRGELNAFAYWDQAAAAREAYRDQIRFGISGAEKEIRLAELQEMVAGFLRKIEEGIEKAVELGEGLVPTYFRFEAESYEPTLDGEGKPVIGGYGLPLVKVTAFRPVPLPYFLEGPARMMKTVASPEKAMEIHRRVKETELFDPVIKMYKTSVSLEGETHEIGRVRAFTAGWLERESIFLHMSYKYVLELLKTGLYEEFYGELQTSLIPFIDPAVYGRSTLENSSFIASSVNPDPHVHGRGFVARLSGSTAEFLSMWIQMMAGKNVFRMENGELTLKLSPKLAGWMFDDAGEVSFTFLGKTKVTYRNPSKADTFGANAAAIRRMTLAKPCGEKVQVEGGVLAGPMAYEVREGAFAAIDVELE